MKTDPQVMAAVFERIASNYRNDVNPMNGIQYKQGNSEEWRDYVMYLDLININPNIEYRLTPETITLQNGVTIPKPLSEEELLCCDDNNKFIPCANALGYVKVLLYRVCDRGHGEIVYKTKEEAIEASKALFT